MTNEIVHYVMYKPWIRTILGLCCSKAWICTCMDNSWIACSIHTSCKTKSTEHGSGQSSDTDVHHGKLFEQAGVQCRHKTNQSAIAAKSERSFSMQIEKLGKYIKFKYMYSIILMLLRRRCHAVLDLSTIFSFSFMCDRTQIHTANLIIIKKYIINNN